MLTLNKIVIEFAGNRLLNEATHQFKEAAVTGLIGRNGAGKSSLLRIIAGENQASGGEVVRPKDSKLRYFHQDLLSFETERSVFEVAKTAFEELLKIKVELDEVLHAIEQGSEDLDLWDKLAHLQDMWEGMEGDKMDARVYEILDGLGFKNNEVHQAYKTFSGGWRMRVLLAKMLLEKPDILLLDEPTNHLDLPSIEWLENYLDSFQGICIVVSHDRFFLDRMVDEIVEISLQQLTAYPGNYSYYLESKAERMDLQQKSYDNQQKYLEQQQRFIDRFKAKASKARQAQSKMKQLEKIELIDAPEEEDFDLSIRFRVKTTSGREVLKLDDISKAYGTKEILRHSHAVIERGDKIALIGANGLGKSTLLRIVADSEPFEGQRKEGYNVETAHYAQHQLESLNLDMNILEELSHAVSNKTELELRTILGCFMFTGDDVLKKIKVLSGGEKSRVALAKVLVSEANFLLLDEPTNHLDMKSINILIQALQAYEGTFIVISHDRHFLSQIANKIWYIEEKELKAYPGTYQEYEYFRQKQLAAAQQQAETQAVKPKAETVKPKVQAASAPDFETQKLLKNKLKKLQRTQSEIEEHITGLEKKKAELLKSLEDPAFATDYAKIADIQHHIAQIDTALHQKTVEWDEISVELEALGE